MKRSGILIRFSAIFSLLYGLRTMEYGTVKWFSNQKGYGFIEREDGGQDAFVHYSDIEEEGWKSLEEDQKVQFELEETDEGPRAKEIEKIEEFPETAASEQPEDSSEEEEDESLEPPEAFQSSGPAVDSDEEQETTDLDDTEDETMGVEKGSTPVTPSSVLDEEEEETEQNIEEEDSEEQRDSSPDW